MPNEIYSFLKDNNLTQLSEQDFTSKYSEPNKAKEIHGFMVENDLTQLDFDGFYDKYMKGNRLSPNDVRQLVETTPGVKLAGINPEDAVKQFSYKTRQEAEALLGKPSAAPKSASGSAMKPVGSPMIQETEVVTEKSQPLAQQSTPSINSGRAIIPQGITGGQLKQMANQMGLPSTLSDEQYDKLSKRVGGKSFYQAQLEFAKEQPSRYDAYKTRKSAYKGIEKELAAELTALEPQLNEFNQKAVEYESALNELKAVTEDETLDINQRNQAINDYNALVRESQAFFEENKGLVEKFENNSKALTSLSRLTKNKAQLKNEIKNGFDAYVATNPVFQNTAVRSFSNAIAPSFLKTLGAVMDMGGYSPISNIPYANTINEKAAEVLFDAADEIELSTSKESKESILDDANSENIQAAIGTTLGFMTTSVLGGVGAANKATAALRTQMATGGAVYGDYYKEGLDAGLSKGQAAIIASVPTLVTAYFGDKGVEAMMSGVGKRILREEIKGAIKDIGKEGTKGLIKRSVDVSKKIAEGIAKESTQETIEQVSEMGAKDFANKYLDANFEGDYSVDGYIKGAKEAAVLGGAFGGLFGGISAIGSDKDIAEVANDAANDPEYENVFRQTVVSLLDNKEITEQQYQEAIQKFEKAKAARNQVPKTVTNEEQQVRATELILQQEELQQELESVNPAMASPIQQKLDEVNAELGSIASGETQEIINNAETPTTNEIQTETQEPTQGEAVQGGEQISATQDDGGKSKDASVSQPDTKGVDELIETKASGTTIVRFPDAEASKKNVEVIKSKPLTRIEGLGMGANQADGIFVSTEAENRYAAMPEAQGKEVQQMEVDIENPFVSYDTNFIDFRNALLNESKQLFTEEDFTEVEIPKGEKWTIDDLSDAGIEKLAKLVSVDLLSKGFDSIYFPQSSENFQEGELVVFDPKNIRVKEGKKSDAKALSSVEETAKALEGVSKEKVEPILNSIGQTLIKKKSKIDIENNSAFTSSGKQIKLKVLKEKYDGDDFIRIKAIDNNGNQVGYARFIDRGGKNIEGLEVEVPQKKQQQGIASAIYSYADALGYNIKKSPLQTKEGKALWRSLEQKQGTPKSLSEAYHKAKADGSNPELVTAVEELLTPKTTQDATQSGEIPKNDQLQYQGTSGQQSGQQENRPDQKTNEPQAEGETGGGDSAAKSGEKQEVSEYGNEGDVKFADGVVLGHRFKIIEADALQPSHLASGQRNPNHLIALAQPKERNDQGSRVQQDKIADNPRLQEVGDSPNAYSGAPVVNNRNEVIQGNNRSIGLKKHYDLGKDSYKKQLAENAEKFGFTKEQVLAMKNPVLVREVAASDQSAIVLGNYDVKDIETGGKQRIDPVTTSRKIKPQDRQKLTTLVFDKDKTVKEAIRESAKEIATIIKSYVNPAQMKTAFNSSGEFTASGMDDMEAIMNSFLYEDGPASLPEVFSTLPNLIQKGIQKGIPALVSTDSEKSLLKDTQNALTAIYEYQQSGMDNFDVWSKSVDMFLGVSPSELFTPLELELARKILDASKQSDISNIFKEYQKNVTDQPPTLLDDAIPGLSKKEAIKKQFNIEYNETTNIKGEGEARVTPSLRPEGEPTPQEGIPEPELPSREEVKEIKDDGFTMPTKDEMEAKRNQINDDFNAAIKELKDSFGDLLSGNLGISYDPKAEAAKLYRFHKGLVNAARMAIRLGMTNVADFAKQLGKPRADKFMERAWKDAQLAESGQPMIINSEDDMLNATYQKVASSYQKQYEDAEKARKPFIKRMINTAQTRWFEADYIARKMLKDVGAFQALIDKTLVFGTSAKAKKQYDNMAEKIFGGLNSTEKIQLNNVIQARTIISIDTRKDAKGEKRPKHPGDTTMEDQKIWLGQLEADNKALYDKINYRADRYFEAQRQLLDERLKEGRITIDQYNGMINNEYSPRVFLEYLVEEQLSGKQKGFGSASQPDIKSLSDGDVNSLYHNAEWLLQTNVLATNRAVFHNRANRSLYDFAVSDPNNGLIQVQNPSGFSKQTGQPTYSDPKTGFKQIQFFDNGVRKSMIVPTEFYNSWNAAEPMINPAFANSMRTLTGGTLKRMFTTAVNPAFALLNIPRDIGHALFFTNSYNPTFPIGLFQIASDIIKVLPDALGKNVRNKNSRYYQYLEEGGGMDFLTVQGRPFERNQLGMSKFEKGVETLSSILGYFNEVSEIMVRLAVREREIKKLTAKFVRDNGRMPSNVVPSGSNMSEQERIQRNATAAARSMMDFSKGGLYAKAVDNFIPYFNASLQGAAVSSRYIKDNPKMFAIKVAQFSGVIVAATLANLRYPEYDDIPEEEKARNIIIMLPTTSKNRDGETVRDYIKIPIPQTLGWLKITTEGITEWAETGKKPNKAGGAAVKMALPYLDFQNIPIVDALNLYASNYDRFLERKVYRKGDNEAENTPDPLEYYADKTPYIYRDLASALDKVGVQLSPERFKEALGKLTADPDNNIWYVITAKAYDRISGAIPKEDRGTFEEEVRKDMLSILSPFERKYFGTTNPNIKKKSVREIEEQYIGVEKLQNDQVEKFARDYISGKKSEIEVKRDFKEWLKVQEKSDTVNVDRLKNKFENSIRFKEVDNVFYRMKSAKREQSKAAVFYYDYVQADANKRELMIAQGQMLGLIPKSKETVFWKEFERLKQNLGD